MLAVSLDGADTLRKFRDSLKAPFHFVADPDGLLVKAFDVKGLLGMSQRYTFVVGEGRKVEAVQSGSDAINPEGAVRACALRKPSAVDAAAQPAPKPAWAGPDAGR